jgi:CheY-like chemotaxis protein
MMGGELSCQSEYGKGSVFTVLIPIVEGDPAKVDSKSLRRVQASPDAKVLVVDDNEINLTVALGFLSKHGIKGETASRGEQAVELAGRKKYDLIFMDHMMPGMDGVEATQLIRGLGDGHGGVPIVALSANAVSGAKESFIGSGMDDFLSKPIAAAELNRMLIKWLPSAKQLGFADPSQPEKGPDPFLELFAELAHLKGLDSALGLSRVDGNKSVYVSVLRQFCKGLDKSVAAIRAALKALDWKNYSIEAHALKTVFANIGVLSLSHWALTLEMAAKADDPAQCLEETDPFCQAMEQFRTSLMGTSLMREPQWEEAKQSVDVKTLKDTLTALAEACLDCDAERASALVNSLSRVTFNDQADAALRELGELVASFDYEEAVKKNIELQAKI